MEIAMTLLAIKSNMGQELRKMGKFRILIFFLNESLQEYDMNITMMYGFCSACNEQMM